MSKFANKSARPLVRNPITTTEQRGLTYEGSLGWARDPKSELFLLAVSNLVAEDTFYESATQRDARFAGLVRQVTAEDPEWIARFVPILRNVFQLRSAAVVMAAEYVAAGGPLGRAVVAAACQRADEPAELLAYWFQTYGRKLPMPVKRGVADAATRLYTERSSLRYDGGGRPWRFGDVIELTHPRPRRFPAQTQLFKYLLDQRHGHTDEEVPPPLVTIAADRWLQGLDEGMRRSVLQSAQFQQAGWSWERLSGWLPGGMDAEAWAAVIPNMGYMALLRNLRNFDEANVPDDIAATVMARLADPSEVARSRQFPLRFLSAYREAASLRWAYALQQALEASLANVPSLPGRTLVLVDLSGSMYSALSGRSKRQRWEVALLFGAAIARRAESADLITYGSDWGPVDFRKPLLRILETDNKSRGGTNTMHALTASYSGHDRVIIVTDEQGHDSGHTYLDRIPLIYTFNVAGYRIAQLPSGAHGRYTFGGLTDSAFTLLPIIEQQQSMDWTKLFEVLTTS